MALLWEGWVEQVAGGGVPLARGAALACVSNYSLCIFTQIRRQMNCGSSLCSDSATTPALPAAHQLTSLLVHRRGEGALPGRRFMLV